MNVTSWELLTPRAHRPLVTVERPSAVITPFEVAAYDGRKRMIRGAAYEDGRLLSESVRRGGVAGDLVVADDPLFLPLDYVSDNLQELGGRWLYLGPYMSHFGHFITEVLPTAWPRGSFDGIVMTPFIFGGAMDPSHVLALSQLFPDLPVRVVGTGCKVETLVVPERPVVLNAWVLSEALLVWEQLSVRSTASRRIFLSRSNLPTDGRSYDNDREVDLLAENLGFEVVHPQELSFDDQLGTIGSAEIIMGAAGSAMHLSAFAPPDARVIELGDRRSPSRPNLMQRAIDSAFNRLSAFVPSASAGNLRDLVGLRDAVCSLI